MKKIKKQPRLKLDRYDFSGLVSMGMPYIQGEANSANSNKSTDPQKVASAIANPYQAAYEKIMDFKNRNKEKLQKLAPVFSTAGNLLYMGSNQPNQDSNITGSSIGMGLQGLAMGSQFGVPGAIIGGALGAGMGLLTAKKRNIEREATDANLYQNYLNNSIQDPYKMKEGGSIHIKESHKGDFTRYAKSKGMGVQESAHWVMANSNNEKLRKQAQFAINSKKFNHKMEEGGDVEDDLTYVSQIAKDGNDIIIPQMSGSVDPKQGIPIKSVQTEKGEKLIFSDGGITDVKAKKKHENMESDEITDTLPVGTYVAGNRDKQLLKKDKAEKVLLGNTPITYNEFEQGDKPEEVRLSDIFKKKEHTPAELTELVKKKFRVTSQESDAFADITNEENKIGRLPYLMSIIEMTEKKKNNVPKMKKGGMVDEYGYSGGINPTNKNPMGMFAISNIGEYGLNNGAGYPFKGKAVIEKPVHEILYSENPADSDIKNAYFNYMDSVNWDSNAIPNNTGSNSSGYQLDPVEITAKRLSNSDDMLKNYAIYNLINNSFQLKNIGIKQTKKGDNILNDYLKSDKSFESFWKNLGSGSKKTWKNGGYDLLFSIDVGDINTPPIPKFKYSGSVGIDPKKIGKAAYDRAIAEGRSEDEAREAGNNAYEDALRASGGYDAAKKEQGSTIIATNPTDTTEDTNYGIPSTNKHNNQSEAPLFEEEKYLKEAFDKYGYILDLSDADIEKEIEKNKDDEDALWSIDVVIGMGLKGADTPEESSRYGKYKRILEQKVIELDNRVKAKAKLDSGAKETDVVDGGKIINSSDKNSNNIKTETDNLSSNKDYGIPSTNKYSDPKYAPSSEEEGVMNELFDKYGYILDLSDADIEKEIEKNKNNKDALWGIRYIISMGLKGSDTPEESSRYKKHADDLDLKIKDARRISSSASDSPYAPPPYAPSDPQLPTTPAIESPNGSLPNNTISPNQQIKQQTPINDLTPKTEADYQLEELYKNYGKQLTNLTDKYNQKYADYFKYARTANAGANMIGALGTALQSSEVNPGLSTTRYADQMFQKVPNYIRDANKSESLAPIYSIARNQGVLSNPVGNSLSRLSPLVGRAIGQVNDTNRRFALDDVAKDSAKYKFLQDTENRNLEKVANAANRSTGMENSKLAQIASFGGKALTGDATILGRQIPTMYGLEKNALDSPLNMATQLATLRLQKEYMDKLNQTPNNLGKVSPMGDFKLNLNPTPVQINGQIPSGVFPVDPETNQTLEEAKKNQIYNPAYMSGGFIEKLSYNDIKNNINKKKNKKK